MSGLILLRPLWLLALLPLAALALWQLYRPARGRWSGLIDPALIASLERLGVLDPGKAARLPLLPIGAAMLLALALTGPALLRPGAAQFRALDPIILLLDLSPSVVAEEQSLQDLQFGAAEILSLAGGRPVGMLVYAADAYLASPPSSDPAALQGLVAVLSRQTMPVAGSRPDIALSMARDLFSDRSGPGLTGADLVLISDGGGAGVRAVEEAARLGSEGSRVWALGLTRPVTGAPAPDAAALEALAAAGHGAALPVARAAELAGRIAAARTARLAREDATGNSFHDFGPWLVPLAMLLIFPLFRRRR